MRKLTRNRSDKFAGEGNRSVTDEETSLADFVIAHKETPEIRDGCSGKE